MKMQKKLTITLILLTIIPAITIGYYVYDISTNTIETQTVNHLVSTNILKSSELDRWIDSNKNSIQWLAQRPLVIRYSEFMASYNITNPEYIDTKKLLITDHLQPRLKYGGFTELFIIDPDSGIIIASTNELQEGKERTDSGYFIEGKNNTYVDGVYYSVPLEQPAMTIGTPIRDNEGNLIAVLAGRLDLNELSDIMEQQSGLNQTEDTYLVNISNFFVTEPRFGDGFALKKTARTTGVEAGLSGKTGTAYYDDYRGVPVIGAYKWLPEYNMSIITEIDQSEAFAPIIRMGWIIAIIVFILIIALVLLAFLIARTITRPLNKLTVGTGIIGSGNLDYKVGIKAKDEIGDLSRAFDSMTEKLKLTTVSRDELAESEKRFRSTLDNMLEGCQIIGYDWRYLYLNDAAVEHSKMKREQLLGHTMMEMYPGIDETELFIWLRHCMEKRVPRHMINQFIYPDGSEGWFELSIQPMTKGISILSWDITERKRMLDVLQEEKDKFAKIVDTAPGAICIFCQKPDGSVYFPYASTVIEDIYDVKPEELAHDARIVTRRIHADDLKDMQKRLVESRRTLSPWFSELRYQHPKKGEVWIGNSFTPAREADGSTSWYGIIQDITERKKAESELKALSTRQQALLATIPEIVIQTDINKVYTWTNQAGLDFFGDDVLGKEASYYFEGEQDTYDIVQPLFEGDESLIYVESWQRRRDGQKRMLAWWCRNLKDDNGNVTGALSTARDITELKEAEEKIRKLNVELEQRVQERTAQLEATNKELEAFAYSVSHDLRAPLRAIDGYTRILLEEYEPFFDKEGKRICTVISDNTRNMGNLIDDLLSFSRLGRAEMQFSTIDMASMAKSIFNEVTSEEERKRIDFQVNSLPPVEGDPSLMRHVWMNLLSNAVKFTSKTRKPVIKVLGKRSRNEVIYTVKDNGVGFDMQYVHKLFGVFQRLHSISEFEGNGVGLAIVQRVIHRHGGKVWAEGAVNKGAKFSFALPFKGGAK
jgi:PAS domain S-box-containing protein